MDIRGKADGLTLIYTATLSRFGSWEVQARSHLNLEPGPSALETVAW